MFRDNFGQRKKSICRKPQTTFAATNSNTLLSLTNYLSQSIFGVELSNGDAFQYKYFSVCSHNCNFTNFEFSFILLFLFITHIFFFAFSMPCSMFVSPNVLPQLIYTVYFCLINFVCRRFVRSFGVFQLQFFCWRDIFSILVSIVRLKQRTMCAALLRLK